jgi:hypothetical protein
MDKFANRTRPGRVGVGIDTKRPNRVGFYLRRLSRRRWLALQFCPGQKGGQDPYPI